MVPRCIRNWGSPKMRWRRAEHPTPSCCGRAPPLDGLSRSCSRIISRTLDPVATTAGALVQVQYHRNGQPVGCRSAARKARHPVRPNLRKCPPLERSVSGWSALWQVRNPHMSRPQSPCAARPGSGARMGAGLSGFGALARKPNASPLNHLPRLNVNGQLSLQTNRCVSPANNRPDQCTSPKTSPGPITRTGACASG